MEEHPIQGLMTTAMENLKDMIEVNTIIGDPVETKDGTVIIPVSQLGFGFAAGGSDFNLSSSHYDDESTLPFGGGSGGGVSITPVAFLVVNSHGVNMVHLKQNNPIYEKMIELAPQAVDKLQQIVKDSGLTKSKKEKKSKNKKNRKRRADDEGYYDDEDYDEESNYQI